MVSTEARLCALNYQHAKKRCAGLGLDPVTGDELQCTFVGIPEQVTGANDKVYEVWRRKDNQKGPHKEGCIHYGQNEEFKKDKYQKRPFPATCVACGSTDGFCSCY